MKKNFMLVCIALILAMTLIVSCDNSNKNPDAGKFTVTFDTDGGDAIDPVKVGLWQTVAEPENPTRDGYKFIEWQLDGKKYDFKTPVTKDITLKAVWEFNGVTVSDEAGLIEAIKNDGYIKLLDDISVDSEIIITKNIILDLNGKTVAKDESSAGTKTWYIIDEGANFTVKNGVMNVEFKINHGTVNLVNSTINSLSAIYLSGTDDNNVQNYSSLNIDKNSTLNVPTYYAIAVYDHNKNWSRGYGISINVYGQVNSKYGISVSGNYGTKSNATINLYEGSSINTGLYIAANSIWNIHGKVEGTIYQKCGEVNIFESAIVNGVAAEDSGWAHHNSGYYIEGSCYVIESCNYPGGYPTANINGGTFNKKEVNAFDILVINWKKDDSSSLTNAVINSTLPYYQTKEVITGHNGTSGVPSDGYVIFKAEGEGANVELVLPTRNS